MEENHCTNCHNDKVNENICKVTIKHLLSPYDIDDICRKPRRADSTKKMMEMAYSLYDKGREVCYLVPIGRAADKIKAFMIRKYNMNWVRVRNNYHKAENNKGGFTIKTITIHTLNEYRWKDNVYFFVDGKDPVKDSGIDEGLSIKDSIIQSKGILVPGFYC